MTYLLFLDESGHDHKTMPYEVRGGVAIHSRDLWNFVQELCESEQRAFGTTLQECGSEIKGYKLLDKDRVKWASSMEALEDVERQLHSKRFLTQAVHRKKPTKLDFVAYGQACKLMAQEIFRLLIKYRARLFASVIPRDVFKPDTYEAENYLRKDQVFLLERFFRFLEMKDETGIIVMDETDKSTDRAFVRKAERYFTHTARGQERAQHIVPAPFFVSSDMTYPVQVADVCIYCINWAFRLPWMKAEKREELSEYNNFIHKVQFKGAYEQDGAEKAIYGIVYVPDPYSGRSA